MMLLLKRVPVFWGHYSILEAQMICLKDLVEESPDWQYVTFITGSEQLMMTNRELVNYLKGSNGTVFQRSYSNRGFTGWVNKKHVLDEKRAYNPDKASTFLNSTWNFLSTQVLG